MFKSPDSTIFDAIGSLLVSDGPKELFYLINHHSQDKIMTMRLSILIILIPIVFMGCQSSATVEEAASTITQESLLSHIEVLSSDEFEGRAPATPGDEKTTEYLVNEFQAMGVEPGMDDGSYTQEVPLL